MSGEQESAPHHLYGIIFDTMAADADLSPVIFQVLPELFRIIRQDQKMK